MQGFNSPTAGCAGARQFDSVARYRLMIMWTRTNNEKPTKNGRYLVFVLSNQSPHPFQSIEKWSNKQGEWRVPGITVTHWQHLPPPPCPEEKDWDVELKRVLQKQGWDKCPCGREIDRGDLEWNSASNESGTPYSSVYITCQACDTEIAYIQDWYPDAEDLEDVCGILENPDSILSAITK